MWTGAQINELFRGREDVTKPAKGQWGTAIGGLILVGLIILVAVLVT